MRLPPRLVAPAAFAAALLLAVLTAYWAALAIETRTREAVDSAMTREDLGWVTVETDGLQVRLGGTAPNEALRFRAVNLTATLVEAGRIRDLMAVTPTKAIEAPRFSVELLRNDDGISLIGLVPATERDAGLAEEVSSIAAGAQVADMLERADFPPPDGWYEAVDYGLSALRMLPRSKISIDAGTVAITAISGSAAEKRRLETELARAKPASLAIKLNISAPRPVLTPFTLRFLREPGGARFDACAADTEAARDTILAAARAAGLEAQTDCTIGLGVPTPRWAEATALGISAVAELGEGSVTFSDADVTLLATVNTPQATFDRVVGELQAALPDVFSLKATLPEKPKEAPAEGPPEFTAVLSDDGGVQLRGRLNDATLRDAVSSYAKAAFGADSVYTATRLDPDLPDGWPVRVLAGLKAMSELAEGRVLVREDTVEVTGITSSPGAQAAITQTLSQQLGQGKDFRVEVRYDEKLDPQAALPAPEECVAKLNAVIARKKITFEPGSAEIDNAARDTMDALAEQMRLCPDIPMEISGHTDSQGSEGGNLALSQARAEAVLLGLQGRRVLVGALTAKGYGEADPLADNETEAGREANRRIEFVLIGAQTAATAPAPGAAADGDAIAGPQAAAEAPGDLPEATGNEVSMDAIDPAGDPDAPSPVGSGDGDPAAPEEEAADGAAEPEEPFVSSAPQSQTLRPKTRPADN